MYHFFTTQLLINLIKKPFENIAEKGENAGNQLFFLFPLCFIPFPTQISIFHSHLFCRLQIAFNLTSMKFSRLVTSIFSISPKLFNTMKDKTNYLTFYSIDTRFLRINNRQLLNILWEKNKLLVNSNFSFSHNVFHSIR